jgi:hypothetical protein
MTSSGGQEKCRPNVLLQCFEESVLIKENNVIPADGVPLWVNINTNDPSAAALQKWEVLAMGKCVL